MIPVHLLQSLPRYRTLSRLRAYFKSEQYQGLADFFTGKKPGGAEEVPLAERAPCVVYPLPKNATAQVVKFMFGATTFPTLEVEEESEGDNHEAIEDALRKFVTYEKVRPAITKLARKTISSSTGVIILGVRRGRFVYESPDAQDCIPTFEDDNPSLPVKELEWAFQYDATEYSEKEKRLVTTRTWFRRTYTATEIVDYAPVEAVPDVAPEWTVSKRTAHGLKRCPVLWVRNCAESSELDGHSLYGEMLNEIDALNFALSQRHKGIRFFGNPQPYETNVDEDDGPEADGRVASGGGPLGAVAEKATKIAPEHIWSYRGNATVGVFETTGAAFKAATDHVNDIRQRMIESMSVVLAGVSDAMGQGGGDVSARLLKLLYAPLLSLVAEYQDETWGDVLVAMLTMQLAIMRDLGPERMGFKDAKLLTDWYASLERKFDDGSTEIMPLPVTLQWGDPFPPNNEDVQVSVTAAGDAVQNGLISQETGAKFVARLFGVVDVEGELADIEERRQALAQEALDGNQVRPERGRNPSDPTGGDGPEDDEEEDD